MKVPEFDLEYTLDCGQAFRWERDGEWWSGVVGDRVIRLHQSRDRLDVEGDADEDFLARYFRFDDDLEAIYADISRDERIAAVIDRFRGLRLIRQDPWECSASYLLASYSNVARIKKMIANLCAAYGRELGGGRYSFPTPQEIAQGGGDIAACRLGYRADWIKRYAAAVASGEFDLEKLKSLDYRGAVEYLKTVKGIGDKVADCIALFSLDHLEACPVDVRIARAMREKYGVTGSYQKVGGYARRHFGPYAGYVQEYLYMAEDPARKRELTDPGPRKPRD